ncbi:Type VI secretion protein, VC_A0111 family [uncultured Desulfatiglans sp.]|nr:Type VI secretion protein, VC_A0111 family [uncultured Desulfatiglans sp.]
MAGQGGRPFSDLKDALIEEGQRFAFYQVIRLLRTLQRPGPEGRKPPADDVGAVRIRPKLDLAFPPADVDRVEELRPDEQGRPVYRVTANFLGLYGVSSPLPVFYTEDLLDEADAEESVTRDFVDAVNQPLFMLLFRAWMKNRLFLQVNEERSSDDLERLFALLGLGEPVLRDAMPGASGLLRYLGLLTQFPRSALGLACLLGDALHGIPMDIIPCILRTAPIPPDQRLSLGSAGNALGKTSYLGETVQDRMGRFRIRAGPLDAASFLALLPGGRDFARLRSLMAFYVTEPLEYDLELVLGAGEARPVCLGGLAWARLGLDTWTFSGGVVEEASVRFFPERLPIPAVHPPHTGTEAGGRSGAAENR